MSAGKLGAGIFVVAIAFLAFVGGSLVTIGKLFPYEILRDAYIAGQALTDKKLNYLDRYQTDLWREARRNERGVTVASDGRALEGYTLYTSGDASVARLIAMDGTLVHEWGLPYSAVWNETAAVARPQRDELIYLAKAHAFANGDLLAIYEAAGDTPWGYGMVKLDRDSEVVWSYLAGTHHDFDITEDGRIFVLTHEFTFEEIPLHERLAQPRLDDYLVVLSPDGEELEKISLTHAMVGSPSASFLHAVPAFALEDPLHTNTVEVIARPKAARFPFGEPGQVLLSFRDIGTVAVLDVERETIVWATRGPWIGQHDPSLLDDGQILLFDNLGGFEAGNRSRILELDPERSTVTTLYVGDADRPFESSIRSSAERLANGNTLITESDGGRLFEVSPRGEIVWEFINPVRGGGQDRYIPVVSQGQRLPAEHFDAEFLALLRQGRPSG